MIGIIGAGPTGLASAYLLKKHGVDFQMIERDSVGSTWKNQYASLRLNSLRDTSALPGLPMPRSYPAFPSAVQFEAYLKQYAETFKFPIQKAEVKEIRPQNSAFEVVTNEGIFSYQTVIIATGIWSAPHHPYANSSPFSGQVLHASKYRTASPFAGKRVLVVGSGASAGDIAVDLVNTAAYVGISIAHGVNIVQPLTSVTAFQIYRAIFEHPWLFKLVRPLLVKTRTDYSSIGLPNHPLVDTQIGYSIIMGDSLVKAVQAGKVNTFSAFKSFTERGAIFADGCAADFDAILFATGYRPAIHFARNCFEMDADGYPQLNEFRSTRHKNIYFVCPGRDYEHNIGWLPSLEKNAKMVVRQILTATYTTQ